MFDVRQIKRRKHIELTIFDYLFDCFLKEGGCPRWRSAMDPVVHIAQWEGANNLVSEISLDVVGLILKNAVYMVWVQRPYVR